MEVENLLKKLIAIDSVTGDEKRLGDFISSQLKPYFRIKKIPVSQGRFNLLAVAGKPRIYFNAHLDTVPIGRNRLREDNARIYGRGACDTKGSIASMITSSISMRRQGYTGFGLFFNVGEEADFCGIRKGLPEKKPKLVIIGEPTGLYPIIGQRGLIELKVIAKGKNAHGARPEEGECAIKKLAKAAVRLDKIRFPKDRLLGSTSVNIGLIKGGSAINVVPDHAEMHVGIRTVCDNRIYKKLLNKELKGYKIKIIQSLDAKILRKEECMEIIKGVTKKKLKVERAFTELYFWPKGIIIGPGDPKVAHSDNEYIEKKQLADATAVYERLIKKFCCSTAD